MNEAVSKSATQADAILRSKVDASFAFVLSPVEITCSLPAKLCDGLTLKRATNDDLERVREQIRGIVSERPPAWSSTQWYESKVTWEEGRVVFTPLPRDQWRYYGLEIADPSINLHNLQLLANIVDPPLDVVSLQLLAGGGVAYYPTTIFNLLAKPFRRSPPIFDDVSLCQIVDAYGLIELIQKDYGEIYRILGLYDDLRMVPVYSAMRALGIFAVVEALITHAPGKHEVGDSLNHQVSTKMPLLSKRFQTPLDYGCFRDANEKTVWQKLYGFRSALAHGRVPDFEKDLAILNNHAVATNFITHAVTTLLRHAIHEPQFYLDLREC